MPIEEGPSVSVATRTLIASGFRITDVQRQPRHIEFSVDRSDIFGAPVRYLVVVAAQTPPTSDEIEYAHRRAERESRTFVVVGADWGDVHLSWDQFLATLGGAVPAWRALAPEFGDIILTLGSNELPPHYQGEAWRLFEDAVGDALEFVLGHRVQRLGSHQRGQAVIDLVARTPDDQIILVDAKAASDAFDVGVESLRPLREYLDRQLIRQQGDLSIGSVLLVANEFRQTHDRAIDLANQFLSDTRLPLAFLRTADLVAMVHGLQASPYHRNKLRWARLLCRLGHVPLSFFLGEMANISRERIGRA